jgi:methylenetetrahydrofolate dehydrogenase (NADP+)/methenyltetrahydrofolate cyclohydrolase
MSEARIIDGKAFAADLRARIADEVAALKAEHGLTPGLAVVLVGEDPASQVYVRNKGEQTLAAGMHSETHRLPADHTQDELLAIVGKLNADPAIHGILVQFPVPDHLNQADIVATISPDKDVDGLTVTNAGRLASGLPALTPCTPLGCMMLLKDVLGDLRGKNAVVIGRSNLMGKPMAQMLLAADCTVTIAHSRSVDLPSIVRRPTSSSPPSAGPRWSRPTGSSRARRSSTSASAASPPAIRRPPRRARPAWSATSPSTRSRPWPARSRRCRAAWGR